MPRPKSPPKPRGTHIQVWLDPVIDKDVIDSWNTLCSMARNNGYGPNRAFSEAVKLLADNQGLLEYLPPAAPANIVESRLMQLVNQLRDMLSRAHIGGSQESTQVDTEAMGAELDEIAASFASSMNEFEIDIPEEN